MTIITLKKLIIQLSFYLLLCSTISNVFGFEDLDVKENILLPEQNYQLLQTFLPRYVDGIIHPWPIIPKIKKLLKLGSHDSAILLLRERLKRSEDLEKLTIVNDFFDKPLEDAVRLYQSRHGLKNDGIVGNETLTQLNIPASQRFQQIRINLDRWADLNSHINDRFILVNVPEFRLHLFDKDQEIMSMRVIVGKPTNQTPSFSSMITRLVFNPAWNIPVSIVTKELIPKMLTDNSYLEKNSIRIFSSQENNAEEIFPTEINWEEEAENGTPYFFRQDPGNKNALGLVKFEFQNEHNIYLHDTPAKNLFDEEQRDFSHGCIRLENPFHLVDYLIQNDLTLDEEKIGKILEAKKTKYFSISHPIPIFITYITAWVDQNKKLHLVNDIYKRDIISS